MTRRISGFATCLAALSATAAILAGCGSRNSNTTSTPASTGANTTASPGVDKKVASEVPAAVKSKRTLTVAADSTAQSKKCTSAGKKPVKVLTFTDQNGANLAITSGRAQVGMADSPVADYQVKKSNGQFKVVGTPYGTAPYGIAIPKDLKLN